MNYKLNESVYNYNRADGEKAAGSCFQASGPPNRFNATRSGEAPRFTRPAAFSRYKDRLPLPMSRPSFLHLSLPTLAVCASLPGRPSPIALSRPSHRSFRWRLPSEQPWLFRPLILWSFYSRLSRLPVRSKDLSERQYCILSFAALCPPL